MISLEEVLNDTETIYKEMEEMMMSYVRSNEWTTTKETSNVTLSTRQSIEHSGKLYRGKKEILVPLNEIMKYLTPLPGHPRLQWDKTMNTLDIIKEISHTDQQRVCVIRTTSPSVLMGMISSRDFIDLIVIKQTSEWCGILAKSIAMSDYPPIDSFVRGTNHYCGVVAIPGSQAGSSELYNIIQSDIRGSIPLKLVDAAVPSTIYNFYKALENYLANSGVLKK